jgi:hypothetical protein
MKSIAIAAATGLVLCAAACSSSSTGSGAAGGHPTSPALTGPASVAASSAAASTAHGGGADSNAWCAELDKAGPAVISAGNPSSLPPGWQQKADQLAADAPAEIRSDVQIVIKQDEKIIQGDANADQTPEFLKAGQHLVQWLGQNCPGLLQKYNPGLPSATG